MSGTTATMLNSGTGAQPIVMHSVPSSTDSFCNGCSVNENYNYVATIQSGTGPITWEIHYASSTALCASGYTTIGSGTITNDANYDTVQASDMEGFYRITLSNAVSSYTSGWTKVNSNCCQQDCCCKSTPGGPCNGTTIGCYDCPETCICDSPCEYDCSCDCVYGYGDGGCNCDPTACDWCAPDCPCQQNGCGQICSCPCGTRCLTGFNECVTVSYGAYYTPPGSC